MAILTEVLKLFKYNLVTDKKSTFNFTLALNNNWDKIDNWANSINKEFTSLKAAVPTLLSQLTNDAGFITQNAVAQNSFYTNVYASGRNFYIEFFNDSSKTNRVFMIQMGYVVGWNTVTFLKPFNVVYGAFCQVITGESCVASPVTNLSTTGFIVRNGTHGGRHEDRGGLGNYWVAFGS